MNPQGLTKGRYWIALGLLLCLSGLLPQVQGQTPNNLRITAVQGVTETTLGAGSTLTMIAATGAATEAEITVAFAGTATAEISQVFVTGSTDYSLVGLPTLPVVLDPDESTTFVLRFSPSVTGQIFGELNVVYAEADVTKTIPIGLLGVSGSGAGGGLLVSYALEATGNAVGLQDGSTLAFLPTSVGTTARARVNLINPSLTPRSVNSVSLSGPEEFRITNLPLVPAAVQPGQVFSFSVNYSPQQLGSSSATLQMNLGGRSISVTVQGSTGMPDWFLSYGVPDTDTVLPLSDGNRLPFPETRVNTTTTIPIIVANRGEGGGFVDRISVAGDGFQLTGIPLLPAQVPANQALVVNLRFSPTMLGSAQGTLRVEVSNKSFTIPIDAVAIGFAYSLLSETGVAAVRPGDSISLPDTAVGESNQVTVQIHNAASTAGQISSIAVTGEGFGLADLPFLPLTLGPNGRESFSMTFQAGEPGVAAGRLRIGDDTFELSVNAILPPPLPRIEFGGAQGVQLAAQQPRISLRLAQPYKLPLQGTLTLTFQSEGFATDPAIRFSTGGTTADFEIPEGATEAVFGNGTGEVGLQTGTVAGRIRVAPSFQLEGGLDVTPEEPTVLALDVMRAPPQLVSVQLASLSSNAFTVILTGFATTRTLDNLELKINAVSGTTISPSSAVINVTGPSQTWYRNAASTPFGSMFSAAIPITLGGRDPDKPVLPLIQSVSVTASNELGSSSPMTVSLQQ